MDKHLKLYLDALGLKNHPYRCVPEYSVEGEIRCTQDVSSYEEAKEWNRIGYALYMLPQRMYSWDGLWGRDNIREMMTLFIDVDDGSPIPDKWHNDMPPTVITKRQNANKWHAYWRISPTDLMDLWVVVERVLVDYYGGDPKVKNPERVMRIPGTLHQKNPNSPDMYKIYAFNDRIYELDEFYYAHKTEIHNLIQKDKIRSESSKLIINDISGCGDAQKYMIDVIKQMIKIPQQNNRHGAAFTWAIDARLAGMSSKEIVEFGTEFLVAAGRDIGTAQGEMVRIVDSLGDYCEPGHHLKRYSNIQQITKKEKLNETGR